MSYLMSTLHYALARKRPHLGGVGRGQQQLLAFIKRTVSRKLGASRIRSMPNGNLLVDARAARGRTSRTLFVAHCDTVHRDDGPNRFVVTDNGNTWKASGAPLGADDGAGVAMLVHLLLNGVPGFYVFTVGEEVGGVGARAFAKLLAPGEEFAGCFDRAIAFDRRGMDSVITQQSCGLCASDEFANALAAALMDKSGEVLMYLPDDSGIYTDTAEFTDYIAECTNVSCGYDMEHTQQETLNVAHLQALAAACLQVDWEALPTARAPGDNGWSSASWGNAFKVSSGHLRAPSSARPLAVTLCDALDFAEQGAPASLRSFMIDMACDWYADDSDVIEIAAQQIERMTFSANLIDEMWFAISSAIPGDEVASACDVFFAELEMEINH